MKMYLKFLLSICITAILLTACGGNNAASQFYIETQQFRRVDIDDYLAMTLSSYNTNEIDGKPIALVLNFTVETEPQLWLFNLLNVQKENLGEGTPSFNSNIKQITLCVDEGKPTVLNVKKIGDSTLMYLPVSNENASSEVDLLFGYITKASEVSVTALMNDDKEYTWKFHSLISEK